MPAQIASAIDADTDIRDSIDLILSTFKPPLKGSLHLSYFCSV
jgi:hypothetical protein